MSDKMQELKELDIISEMDKLVDRKLSEVKSTVPVILTIVTAVIAFLVTLKISSDNFIFLAVVILATILLLITFLYLLLIFYPVLKLKKSYKISRMIDKKLINIKSKIFGNTIGIVPWDLKSYLKLPDEEFLVELEKYFKRSLTEVEIIKANFLKNKINELYWKRRILNSVYSILIIGTIIFIVLCYVSIALL